MSYEIQLHFPHIDWTVQMPAVPRTGDIMLWEEDDDLGEGRWQVNEVEYTAYRDQLGSINLTLDPADDHTRSLLEKAEAAQEQRRSAARRDADRTTEK